MYSIVSTTPGQSSDVLVHAYPRDLATGKQALRILARRAFKEATQNHITLSKVDLDAIPILDFNEFYTQIKGDSLDRFFLNNHVLMFANAEETCIELLSYQETSEWYYVKYVTTKKAVISRVFALRAFQPMDSVDAIDYAGKTANDSLLAVPAATTISTLAGAATDVPFPPPSPPVHCGKKDATPSPITTVTGKHGNIGSQGTAAPGMGDSDAIVPSRRQLLPPGGDAELKMKIEKRRLALEQAAAIQEIREVVVTATPPVL